MEKFIVFGLITIMLTSCLPSDNSTPNDFSSMFKPTNLPDELTTKGKITVKIVGKGRVYSSPTKDIDCPGVCTASLSDEFPFLNTEPAEGWIFSEWQGDSIGCFTEHCPLTPNDLKQDAMVIAVFEQVDTSYIE